MTEDLPFLQRGERLPVDVLGRDVDGREVRLDDVLEGNERVLLYFYPLDERDEPPAAWRRLEEKASDLITRGTAVVGVRGPAITTARTRIRDRPFPLIEDHNYGIGQAVGILGGDEGDELRPEGPPRGLVLLDHEGRVLAARRGDDPRTLDDVLPGL